MNEQRHVTSFVVKCNRLSEREKTSTWKYFFANRRTFSKPVGNAYRQWIVFLNDE